MTKIGFVILAHDNIFRLRQVVSHLIAQDVPIVLHLDQKIAPHKREALEYFFRNEPRIYWAKSIECEWGDWSIVEAQIISTQLLLEKEPDLDYVYHISGSCLPLRPIDELREFLAEPGFPVDYIESVAIGDEQWVYDGLNQERIELYHPFNWRKNRKLFDWNVKLQRAVKFKRKIPKELIPSFGSQWWCLSTSTLRRIFSDKQFQDYCEFFSKSWIPDESFFQTLARKHSAKIEPRSLTYATFDDQGKPFLIYDDHLHILSRIDSFFIRKIWRGADALYAHFLDPSREILRRDPYALLELQALLDHAKNSCINGRPGLLSQFTAPRHDFSLRTRAPYFIYFGFHTVRTQIYEYYYGSPTRAQMGYLFHPNRTEFELSKHKTPKNAPDLFKFRDYNKLQFLTQRVWNAYPRNIAFLAKPHHFRYYSYSLSRDPNANVLFVKGAWLLELFERNIENVERLRTICRIEMRRENSFFKPINGNSRANFSVFDLSELLTEPEKISEKFPDQFELSAPEIDLNEFRQFLSKLSQNGVSLKKYNLRKIDDALIDPAIPDQEHVISLAEYAKTKNG